MKNILFILSIIFSVAAFSQDTLYTTKGKIITGLVKEITQHEIKYKRAANPDGPLYVIDKIDIVLIHYKNGTKEVFENSGSASTNVSSNDNSDPVYVNTRPRVNVIVGAPLYAFAGGWGWGWGGWGWNRPFCGGNYRSFRNNHWHHNHHNHFGHYGRRGGGRR